jgi:hypothetical protein
MNIKIIKEYVNKVKCPKCIFQNVHRETIEHHMKYKDQQNEQKSTAEQ